MAYRESASQYTLLQGDKVTGKVKEGFGNVTGDDSKKAEGRLLGLA